jgi:hypothetical protein
VRAPGPPERLGEPTTSMDARPFYLRQLGETMESVDLTAATRSSLFPRVKQKPLHCMTGRRTPKWCGHTG